MTAPEPTFPLRLVLLLRGCKGFPRPTSLPGGENKKDDIHVNQ
jgi:hypothetical protein